MAVPAMQEISPQSRGRLGTGFCGRSLSISKFSVTIPRKSFWLNHGLSPGGEMAGGERLLGVLAAWRQHGEVMWM